MATAHILWAFEENPKILSHTAAHSRTQTEIICLSGEILSWAAAYSLAWIGWGRGLDGARRDQETVHVAGRIMAHSYLAKTAI